MRPAFSGIPSHASNLKPHQSAQVANHDGLVDGLECFLMTTEQAQTVAEAVETPGEVRLERLGVTLCQGTVQADSLFHRGERLFMAAMRTQ
jgi:hypothetical protein